MIAAITNCTLTCGEVEDPEVGPANNQRFTRRRTSSAALSCRTAAFGAMFIVLDAGEKGRK